MQRNNKFYLILTLGLIFGLTGFNNIKSGNCGSSRKGSATTTATTPTRNVSMAVVDFDVVNATSFFDTQDDRTAFRALVRANMVVNKVRYLSEFDYYSEDLGLGGRKRTYGYRYGKHPKEIITTLESDRALQFITNERRDERIARRAFFKSTTHSQREENRARRARKLIKRKKREARLAGQTS